MPEGPLRTVHGRRTVEEYLRRTDPAHLVKLWLDRSNKPETNRTLIDLARSRGIPFAVLDPDAFRRMTDDPKHSQGVLLTLRDRTLTEDDLHDRLRTSPPPLVLVLDHIEDPANLGSILRTCGFYGCDTVVIPTDRAAQLSPAVEKVASGGLSAVRLHRVVNLARVLRSLKNDHGYWTVASVADPDATPLHTLHIPQPAALVVGNEHKGVSRLLLDLCDLRVAIHGSGPVASLNAAVATAVLLDRFFHPPQRP